MQGYVFLEAMEGRQIFNLVIPNRVSSLLSATPPTVNISIIGYDKSLERSLCLMASVKTCVTEQNR